MTRKSGGMKNTVKKLKVKLVKLLKKLKKVNLRLSPLPVDQWQDKRKKYIQSKYFRMLQKKGKVNNPNMAPLGEKNCQKSDSDR